MPTKECKSIREMQEFLAQVVKEGANPEAPVYAAGKGVLLDYKPLQFEDGSVVVCLSVQPAY